jgi:hypothetical protein
MALHYFDGLTACLGKKGFPKEAATGRREQAQSPVALIPLQRGPHSDRIGAFQPFRFGHRTILP